MIREARIKVLTADVTAKTDTLQEYSQRKRDSYVVLDGVAPLDKTRAAHSKTALSTPHSELKGIHEGTFHSALPLAGLVEEIFRSPTKVIAFSDNETACGT